MRRWLLGDQLGPHHLDDAGQPVLLVESRAVLRRRRFHRQKAHLVLSAIRHRAAELGDQAVFPRTGTYGEALTDLSEPVTVSQPSTVLGGLRERGWVHHIARLMVLGNYALQRGFSPAELTEWFHVSFVDG
jgi:deoxyribodipyrimidine photolyase-like uncharacterized protein